jgi:sugar lactone lactonase YvrE
MASQPSRYAAAIPATPAGDWTLARITPPSRLFGANGMRTGADGRIYVAQVSGSQISAIDPDSGAIETISPLGGNVVAPDDLVFDDDGNIYVTEITEGRIGMLAPNGSYKVIQGDMPVANPITFHQGRLIAGECRIGGRIMELDRAGGAPRMILQDVPMPNAFTVGPDGKLYFPVMGTNEIWRVDLAGSAPEVVARDLGVPDSVKFDAEGFIVSTQVYSGQVLRIDPRTGAQSVLASLTPGLDNCTFVGDRLFVSNITGYVTEVLAGGKTRDLVPDGLNWPLGLAMGDDGRLFVADGAFTYLMPPGGERTLAGMIFTPNFPGYTRGVAAAGDGEYIVTTAQGVVARWWPAKEQNEILGSGYDQLYGVAVSSTGAIAFAEMPTGRVFGAGSGAIEELASGLDRPKGVAFDDSGNCFVSESGAGRVVRLAGGKAETVLDGLGTPEGIIVRDGSLFVVDTGSKSLIAFDLTTGTRTTIASNLPVGAPPGVVPKFLAAIGDLSGPMGPFAAITAGPDSTLYVSGDAEGSVLAIRPA